MEQKNFTHVRQLLGYGRYDDLRLIERVNDLYENAWLPLRNLFTPAMKLVEKKRTGSKIARTYDHPQTPCDQVPEATKQQLNARRTALDPMKLAELIEAKLQVIADLIGEIEERRAEERSRAGEGDGGRSPAATT